MGYKQQPYAPLHIVIVVARLEDVDMDNLELKARLQCKDMPTSISLWDTILMGNQEHPILCFVQVGCFLFGNFGGLSDSLPIFPGQDDVGFEQVIRL